MEAFENRGAVVRVAVVAVEVVRDAGGRLMMMAMRVVPGGDVVGGFGCWWFDSYFKEAVPTLSHRQPVTSLIPSGVVALPPCDMRTIKHP